jgi:hypothetical protein
VKRSGGIWTAQFLLAGALATGAQARTLTLRLEVVHGQVEFFHQGKRLKDSTLERLCATARQQKVDIEFQRDKMTRDDALTAIMGEAQCLGAPRSASMPPKPDAAARTHARHRHTAGTPR